MERPMTNAVKARILVITGPGKGKTTAAAGLALRAVARGRAVLITRFAKSGRSGEIDVLSSLSGVSVLSGACGMTPPPGHPDFPRHVAEARRLFRETCSRAARAQTLVLDEICGAVARGLVDEAEVVGFLEGLDGDQVAVLTGRGAGPGLLAVADTVSEILSLKHGYERGIDAQPGVEL